MSSHSRSTRYSNASSSSRTAVATSSAYRPLTPAPVEVITLKYEDSPVFVKRPETLQEAVATAKKEYYQLAHIPAHRVGFFMNNFIRGESGFVRVSESAWVAIATTLPSGSVINVRVLPDPDEKRPPQYGSLLDLPTLPHQDGRYLRVHRAASSASLQTNASKTGHGLLSWMGVGK